jgi:hypothetical protein
LRIDSGTFTAVLAFATFIFAVAGVAGTWRASRSTSALNSYRDTAAAWEAKADAQAMQIRDLEADGAKKDQRIAELEGKVAILSDTLTGKAAWEILEGKISEALVLIAETRGDVRNMVKKMEQP